MRANPFKTRLTALAVASCLGSVTGMADAAGMGRLTVLSALGQPLQAEIEVSAVKEELPGMVARLAHPDAYRAAGIDYGTILRSVRLVLDKKPNGQVFIKVSSESSMADPFVDMLIELSWSSGRLVREYTLLLDPPETVKAAPPAPVPVAEVPPKAAEKAPEPAKVVEKVPEPVKAAEPAKEIEKAPEKAPVDKKKITEDATAKERTGSEVTSRAVKSGDTLGKIAKEMKPEGVTLDQMLVGLFRANPDAFSGKNMNRLKAGKILVVPVRDEVESTSAADSKKEVLAQASDWNAYRRKVAGMVAQAPAAEVAAPKEAAGKITAKVEDKAAAKTDVKDQVKVSKTETQAVVPPAAAKKSAEEDRIAKERALKESAERAAQLEKNVADLQKLVELKNQSMAQAQAKAAPAPAKPVDPVKPAAAVPAPAATTPAPVPPVVAPAPAAADPAKTAAASQPAPKPDAKPAELPKPKPKVVVPSPPEEEESLMENPAVWGGLVALLGGIGGLIFYRRRKASSQGSEAAGAVPSLGEPSLGANSVFRATGGQSIDTSAATPAVTDFSQTGPGTIDTDEVDPVAEAEVYMAYGRDAQAEEILLEALQKDSKRLAVHLKLLEIYAQRKSAKQFETLATELYAQTGGAGVEWEKAVAMGSKLDPANPLYSGGASTPVGQPFAAASSFNPDATMVTSPGETEKSTQATTVMPGAFAQMAGFADPAPSASNDLGSLADALGIQASNQPAAALGAGSAADGKLTFDFDLGSPAETPGFDGKATTRLDAPPLPAAGSAMDFDLGSVDLLNMDVMASKPDSDSTMVLDRGAVAAAQQAAEAAPLSVDISFDLPEASNVPASGATSSGLDFNLDGGMKSDISGRPEAGGGLDFDLGLSASAFETGLPAEPMKKPDMSAINLDLGAPADLGADFATTMFDPSGSLSDVSGGSDSGRTQEVATKLDLAKAYEEMGDAEGARELLQEVLAEGNGEQQAAASAILKRIG